MTETNSAFITGAASGIGKAVAERLYHLGWTLGLADLNTDALSELTDSWNSGRAHTYALNVTESEQVTSCLNDFVQKTQGKLNVLVNSAGILSIDSFQNISAERHRLIMDINVMGVMNTCLAAYPYLKETKQAVVVNMSSSAATYGVPMLASYSASKFAVSGLTEALNIEWEDDDIHLCALMPPMVSTNMLEGQKLPPVMQKLGAKITPEDVADVVIRCIERPRLHNPLGLRFKVLNAANQISPRWLTGVVMRLMHRY